MITITGRIAAIIRRGPAEIRLPLDGFASGDCSEEVAAGGRASARRTKTRRTPQWLLKLLGPEYFCRVNFVSLAGSRQETRAIRDLAFLDGLPDVRVLHLDSATFADSEVAHARPLKLIRFLAEDSSLGDEGLAYLAGMNEVWEIGLAGSRVTDAGLEYLARMPRLRFVDLRGSRLRIPAWLACPV